MLKALSWTPLVLALALLLPGTAAAASLGRVVISNGYCSGDNTVNATAKNIKYSGYYATHLTLVVKGQGYHAGRWRTEATVGPWKKWVYTSGRATFQRSIKWDPGHSGKHRIRVIAKVWNGGRLLAKGSVNSGTCI